MSSWIVLVRGVLVADQSAARRPTPHRTAPTAGGDLPSVLLTQDIPPTRGRRQSRSGSGEGDGSRFRSRLPRRAAHSCRHAPQDHCRRIQSTAVLWTALSVSQERLLFRGRFMVLCSNQIGAPPRPRRIGRSHQLRGSPAGVPGSGTCARAAPSSRRRSRRLRPSA